MPARLNRRWVLAKRPIGEPTEDCFELQEVPVPELAAGEVLVEVHFLSLDPYMRGRMRDAKSYAEPVKIGEVITGESAGVIVESNSDRWSVGDCVTVHQGWQSLIAVAGWIQSGQLKYRETIAEGIESAPAAFRGLLAGKNFGKQLVRVAR